MPLPAGLERLLDEAARLRASTAADDASSAADRKARSLAMQAKLRDIAEAQVCILGMWCLAVHMCQRLAKIMTERPTCQ